MGIEEQGMTGWAEPLARLRQALDQDEFVLFGQPMRALRDPAAEPIAELLVRLREEEKALQPPGEFLPAFEHYKMMPELDGWVLRHLLKQVARASRAQRFSVNVSRQTLEQDRLPKLFAHGIKVSGVRAASVLFEIDESDLLECPQAVTAFASQIKAAGGGVAVDGFGRKSVSFAPVLALRPDFIKVDGTITRRLLSNPACARKLDAILKFCNPLRIEVIAECVEEREVLARLKLLGVGYAQGFGIALPRPIGELLLRDSGAGAQKAATAGVPQ